MMNEQVKEYISQYPEAIRELFAELKQILYSAVANEPEETLWAKLPSYYVGEAFVRLIPFKDHINIEAKALLQHPDELNGYKMTPKGMLQIKIGQKIPGEVLKQVFAETLL